MRQMLLLSVALVLASPLARAASTNDTLANPTDYSFDPVGAPPPPLPGAAPLSSRPSAVVSSTVGNRGEGGSVAMDSGLLDGTTHIFVTAAGGQTQPWKHGPTLTTRDVGVGVSTLLPDDAGSVTVMFNSAQGNWGRR